MKKEAAFMKLLFSDAIKAPIAFRSAASVPEEARKILIFSGMVCLMSSLMMRD